MYVSKQLKKKKLKKKWKKKKNKKITKNSYLSNCQVIKNTQPNENSTNDIAVRYANLKYFIVKLDLKKKDFIQSIM